jgi:DNA-binding MarR family transcriptional regulator
MDNIKDKDLKIADIDAYLGYWLRFVSNQVTNAFQQKLAKEGATVAEWLILRFLWSHAPCSLTKLSEVMGVDKGSISRLTDRLEKRCLIKRNTNLKDRRFYSIELTPEGHALVPKLAKIADENDSDFFNHLSSQQFKDVMSFLKDMVQRYHFSHKPLD